MTGQEINIGTLDGVTIRASVYQPTGSGALDPNILLHNTIDAIDGKRITEFSIQRTFDTFKGRRPDAETDWYLIAFPDVMPLNCIEMTMGFPYRDGGWWTSLKVEVRLNESAEWQAVDNLRFWPNYDFEDVRGERRPFETYMLRFDEVLAKEVRLIGRGGGTAKFTSLARIALFLRDFSRWLPTLHAQVPIPYVYKVIDPQTLWDLSENLSKLSGLSIDFPMLEYYLDHNRYAQYWQQVEKNYSGSPEIWFFIGDVLGWHRWREIEADIAAMPKGSQSDPYVKQVLNGLGRAVAPLVVDGMYLGDLTTNWVVISDDPLDWDWHQQFAEGNNIPWEDYQAAMAQTPQKSLEQLNAAATLMKLIANTIANLAHTNMSLQNAVYNNDYIADTQARQISLVQHALEYMKENVESEISIADVARYVALSLPYFCTVFAKHTGRNPGDYLIDLKIERAKHYFTYTNMSVMDVCVALGYSPSYFARLFKKQLGCTPSQYALRVRAD